MNLKQMSMLLVMFALVVATAQFAHAQNNASSIWLRVADDAVVSDSIVLTLSNAAPATYNKDDLGGEYVEQEAPPGAPSFDARFVQIAVNKPGEYGSGFQPLDLRGIPSNAAQLDTFVVQITNGDATAAAANFQISWPNPLYLAGRCDSAFIQDKTNLLTEMDGVTPIGKVNMFTRSQIDILAPLQTLAIFKMTILKYGVKLVDDLAAPLPTVIAAVRELSNNVPASFALKQNFPNPFNPTTTITFDIQKRSFVDIAVFNLLGQKVSSLVSEDVNPGSFSTVWNGTTGQGSPAGSGVYFVRMTAHSLDGKGETFSSLRKIVLMK